MKVLILTGKFGNGHLSASEAVKEELEQKRGAEAEIIDMIELLFPRCHKQIYSAFAVMSSRFYHLYNFINRLDDRRTKSRLQYYRFKRFHALMEEKKPDVVISTLPVTSKYIGAYLRKSGKSIPYVTCITDILPHSQWISEESTAYVVGGERTKQMLVERGIDPAIIHVAGVPVRSAFTEHGARGKASGGRRKQDLRTKAAKMKREKSGSSRPKRVLIMGGGFGLMPNLEELLDVLSKDKRVKITVITGKNEKLRKRLRTKYPRVEAVGYTNRIADYMRRSDLLVTKAGGVTLFEAVWAGIPIFFLTPFLEQEKSNAAFAEEQQIAVVENRLPIPTSEQILALLADDRKRARMQANMKRLTETYAANRLSMII